MSTQPAIEISRLSKSFGATRAVDGIDLQIAQGSVYGLLGPNGAGKTWLSLLRSDSHLNGDENRRKRKETNMQSP